MSHDTLALPDVVCQIWVPPATQPAVSHEQGARMASFAQDLPSGDAEGGVGYWPRAGHVHLLPALD